MARRERTSYDAQVQEKPAFDLDQLAEGGPQIEVVRDGDFQKLAEDTKFMNEPVQVRFLPSNDPNATKLVELGANISSRDGKSGGQSVKRGFERGKVYTIPRYLVEVAAHAKTQVLEQSTDPRDPYRIMQSLRDSFTYPFEIVSDPSPKGRAWLDHVLADPA